VDVLLYAKPTVDVSRDRVPPADKARMATQYYAPIEKYASFIEGDILFNVRVLEGKAPKTHHKK